jgi:Tol biopolymer transport system component
VEVTTDAAMDWNPVWSPDGKYLYFASDRGGA